MRTPTNRGSFDPSNPDRVELARRVDDLLPSDFYRMHPRAQEAAHREAQHLAGVRPTAWHRDEGDPCERGTVGCSIDHAAELLTDGECATW